MSIITQLPEQLDSNITIHPPAQIDIKYSVGNGWYIMLDNKPANTGFFTDASGPMDWLIERDLVKTKAYTVLADKVKKAARNKK
jgi:hypothetical protein